MKELEALIVDGLLSDIVLDSTSSRSISSLVVIHIHTPSVTG